nr:MAG TPA: hypothetical protein [Caudoviricetes sp.]DAZ54152.1 MAG TPA: hypothetical protein [Caudoviricetes sp.]
MRTETGGVMQYSCKNGAKMQDGQPCDGHRRP